MTRSPHPDMVHAELALHQWLKAKLLEDHQDLDEDTVADTLEGATRLTELLSAVVRHQMDDLALVKALKGRIAEMRGRLERLEGRVARARKLVGMAMEQAELKRLNEPEFTVSLRPAAPPLLIIDEGAIPDAYWEPQPAKLKRQELRAALGDGKDIPGAVLGNPRRAVSIRTR